METTMNDRILEAALKGFVKEASPELEFLRRRSVEVQERMVERILSRLTTASSEKGRFRQSRNIITGRQSNQPG